MGLGLRGFLHAEPGARLRKMAHTESRILRFKGGERESEAPLEGENSSEIQAEPSKKPTAVDTAPRHRVRRTLSAA